MLEKFSIQKASIVSMLNKKFVNQVQDCFQKAGNRLIKNLVGKSFCETLSNIYDNGSFGGTDFLSFINETIFLATKSEHKYLIQITHICGLVALCSFCRSMLHQLASEFDIEKSEFYLVSLACLANDCSTLIECLDEVYQTSIEQGFISENDLNEVRKFLERIWDKVFEHVTDVIETDINILVDLLFTKMHLNPKSKAEADNVFRRIIATVEDYLTDLHLLLKPDLYVKLLKTTLDWLVALYVITYVEQFIFSILHTSRLEKLLCNPSSKQLCSSTSMLIGKVIETDSKNMLDTFVRQFLAAGLTSTFATCIVSKKVEVINFVFQAASVSNKGKCLNLLQNAYFRTHIQRLFDICDTPTGHLFGINSTLTKIEPELEPFAGTQWEESKLDCQLLCSVVDKLDMNAPGTVVGSSDGEISQLLFSSIRSKQLEIGVISELDIQKLETASSCFPSKQSKLCMLERKTQLNVLNLTKQNLIAGYKLLERQHAEDKTKIIPRNVAENIRKLFHDGANKLNGICSAFVTFIGLKQKNLEGQAISGIALLYKKTGQFEEAAIFFQVAAGIFKEENLTKLSDGCIKEAANLYANLEEPGLYTKLVQEYKTRISASVYNDLTLSEYFVPTRFKTKLATEVKKRTRCAII
eukprot:snap_masked-scaffold_3-processed-gene-9.29-mRNA-1 protein AED:1.00 eAED:1.00 QI:0/0/0/0/1/1/5/0/639